MLTAHELGKEEWTRIAQTMSWTQLRMSLNTLLRHRVFEDSEMIAFVARQLEDASNVRRAKCFPYQLMVAYKYCDSNLPRDLRTSLAIALDRAVSDNLPTIEGQIVVACDMSGSMSSPATGRRRGSTSKATCGDVSALFAAAMLRKNPNTIILPFQERVIPCPDMEPMDSVMTNANKLSHLVAGGTDCSAPLALLNHGENTKKPIDLIVFVSDNESWVDHHRGVAWARTYFPARSPYNLLGHMPAPTCTSTGFMEEWARLKGRNPNCRMVCIDIQPYQSRQLEERHSDQKDILQVGGFSDLVFQVIADFANGGLGSNLVDQVNEVEL
jgi:60 kDa SS-A/Ro ribonucleoprotein